MYVNVAKQDDIESTNVADDKIVSLTNLQIL